MKIEAVASKAFGATVTGVRLPNLTDDEFAQLHQAFLEFGFLIFPGQFLTDEQNIEFGERFGPLEFGAAPLANKRRDEQGGFSGDVVPTESQLMKTNIGNEAWHTDSTYWPISSKCAMLSAVTVPATGGETQLADTRHAYAALSDARKATIADAAPR